MIQLLINYLVRWSIKDKTLLIFCFSLSLVLYARAQLAEGESTLSTAFTKKISSLRLRFTKLVENYRTQSCGLRSKEEARVARRLLISSGLEFEHFNTIKKDEHTKNELAKVRSLPQNHEISAASSPGVSNFGSKSNSLNNKRKTPAKAAEKTKKPKNINTTKRSRLIEDESHDDESEANSDKSDTE